MLPQQFGVWVLALGLSAFVGAATARADCNTDVQKMSLDRAAALKAINETVAAAKGKQLDPSVFCEKSQPLLTIEAKMLAYMAKNQDWCGIPQGLIDQLKEAHTKSAGFAGRACKVAEQMKKAKESGEAGGPPPLPAGPL